MAPMITTQSVCESIVYQTEPAAEIRGVVPMENGEENDIHLNDNVK